MEEKERASDKEEEGERSAVHDCSLVGLVGNTLAELVRPQNLPLTVGFALSYAL